MVYLRDACPVCGGPLIDLAVTCGQCHTHFDSTTEVFAAPPPEDVSALDRFGSLVRLSPEQIHFVETFVRARGIIKTVEGMLGISYPTVRNRLDDVIATMGLSPTDERPAGEARREQRDILDDLVAGRIDATEAHELLRRLASHSRPTEDDPR